jgi:deoxyribodipyrimidine photo-lyase
MTHLVWFKRDLRLHDHGALTEAIAAARAAGGGVVCVYFYEPDVLASPDTDACHVHFVNQCLTELRTKLRSLRTPLLVRRAVLPDGFDELRMQLAAAGVPRVAAIWSHEETGNAVTFARDIRVERWCKAHDIRWTQIPQHGVIRRLRSRDRWSAMWESRMGEKPVDEPRSVPAPDGLLSALKERTLHAGDLLTTTQLGLGQSTKTQAQLGGESHGLAMLHSFLNERAPAYRKGMSSPVTAWQDCSRISPHLAWGSLSLRTVYHATSQRQTEAQALVDAGAPLDRRWLQSLTSFQARLRWHCHFIQKLEDEPSIEFENFNHAYDGLRDDPDATPATQRRFLAWQQGKTGYPLIDACMRCLHAAGWINFRMRAMLASFASYHLWLHWRQPAIYLARQFVDFEPGIHFSQFQMQSGTTGINTVRIYSPIKQVQDHDPQGVFIRRWVPELIDVPHEFLAQPHTMPSLTQHMARCVIDSDYPSPIVDHREAYAFAKRMMFERKATPAARTAARTVYAKHGSRKKPGTPRFRGSEQEQREREELFRDDPTPPPRRRSPRGQTP